MKDEFLLADFGHVAESLLQNEEAGEKRVTFFTTLVTAFLGGAGYLSTEMKEVVPINAWLLMALVSLVLVLLGLLTVLRLIRRNEVTDQYKAVLEQMRRDANGGAVPDYAKKFGAGKRSLLRGGHLAFVWVLTFVLGAITVGSFLNYANHSAH